MDCKPYEYKQYTIECEDIPLHGYVTFRWDFVVKITTTSQHVFSVTLKQSGHFQKGDEAKAFENGKRAIHDLIDNSSIPLEDEYCCSWDRDYGLKWEDCNDSLYKRN